MSSVAELIIGIDLGSTCMTGVLGKKISGGTELIALSQIPVVSGIRRGVIHNIDVVSRGIQELLDNLQSKFESKFKVEQVYIGINGYSIRTIDIKSSTTLSGDEILNEMHLDLLTDEVEDKIPDNLDIIEVFPQEFIVDGKVDLNPVGSMPENVEAHYKVVAGKPVILRNLMTCIERVHINYEPVLGPLASAEAVLEADEKSRGVVTVDFGAETTSVCIYKNNVVRYISILPFGGNSITKDLLNLNIDEDDAESLKLKSGTAIHYSEKSNTDSEESLLSTISDFDKETNEIIVARAEEIVENIYAQLRFSGAELQKLTSGIVITGGASQLPGLDAILSKKSGLPVRIGNPLQNIISKPDSIFVEPGDSLAIGLLLLGRADCCKIPDPVEKPEVKPIEKQDTVKSQTLGGDFEDENEGEIEEKKKKVKVKKEKPVKTEKSPGKFSSFIKNIFDDEDL
jgi:cell division protein FtsA